MRFKTETAIDIGTNSVKIIVCRRNAGGVEVDLIAKEEEPHFIGVRKGEVYDPKKASEALLKAKERIEKREKIKLKKAVLSAGGFHLFPLKSQGLISVSRADGRISPEDVERVLQAAKAVSLPPNKEVLEVIPQEFIIDGEEGIKKAVGLKGVRLEAKVLLVCIFSPALENLESAAWNAGIEPEEIIPSVSAFSEGVLNSEQKEIGAAVLNIGAGTTSLAVFSEGCLKDFKVFPVGSANITNDIALGLRIDIKTAEFIKKEFASLKTFCRRGSSSRKGKKEKIELAEQGVSFSRSFLEEILEFRISEIFREINKDLKRISKEVSLPAGVIFTGGGSLLPGLTDFAKQKLQLPCFLPEKESTEEENDNRLFSTCEGIIALRAEEENEIATEGRKRWKNIFKKAFKVFLP